MMRPSQYSTSLDPHLRKIRPFLIKNPKHIRTVKPFYDYDDVPQILISRLLKKLRTAKTLRSLTLQPSTFDLEIKPEKIQSILKIHSQELKVLDASTFHYLFSSSNKSPKFPMKNLCKLTLSNVPSNLRALRSLRTLNTLLLDLRCPDIQKNLIYLSLLRLINLKKLAVLPSPSTLKKALELLNGFALKSKYPVNVQVFSKDNEQYSDNLSSLNGALSQVLTKIHLQYIKETSVLDSLFLKPTCLLSNLKSLKLEFCASDLRLISYLKYLKHIIVLEKLSLGFAECHSKEFSEQVMRQLQLPDTLKSLKINMSMSLQNLLAKYQDIINNTEEKYLWRHINIFELEPLFLSFFRTLEEATSLRKLQFEFQMLEKFNSHFTNFFISILHRLRNLTCFSFSVNECHESQNEGQDKPVSECFDLALLLQTCSNMDFLENIEVIMPNFLFEDAKLSTNLSCLKGFNLGVSEQEEENTLKFQDISRYVTRFIKTLAFNAPSLNMLIFDFGEQIDGKTFDKRFSLLRNLQNLEFLCTKLFVQKCSPEQVKSVGEALQSLQKLDTLSLRFPDSDENIRQLSTYLKYQKSFREALVIVNNTDWTGDENEEFETFRMDQERPENNEDDSDNDENLSETSEVELEM